MIMQTRRGRTAGRPFLALAAVVIAMAGSAAQAKAEAATAPIETKASDDFWIGDFAALERKNAQLSESGGYTPEGRAKLDLFREELTSVFDHDARPREPYLRELDALTLQWTTQYPQSALAHILHARSLFAHGWSYRGNGMAHQVPPQAWKDFESYLRSAVKYLNDHGEVALRDSYAHVTLLDIVRGLGFSQKQRDVIVQDGLKRNPRDLNLYAVASLALLPKWGGDSGTLDKYIRQAAAQTRAEHGASLYASLYWEAAVHQYGHALFDGSQADWPTMKQGYEDILARSPDSVSQRNRYAYFACLAKDKMTLLEQLEKIGTRLDTAEWGANGERILERCQRLASEA